MRFRVQPYRCPLIKLKKYALAEIQELRHAAGPSHASIEGNASAVQEHLTDLDNAITLLEGKIKDLDARLGTGKSQDDVPGLVELEDDWKSLQVEHEILKQEVKDDGWLIRFRMYDSLIHLTCNNGVAELMMMQDGGSGRVDDGSTTKEHDGVPCKSVYMRHWICS